MRARSILAALLSVLGLAVAGVALAAEPAPPVISNFGRSIDPSGALTRLGYFPAGAALTPDGRFAWTVGAARRSNDVQITDTSTGAVVQTIAEDGRGKQGGVAIARDGRRAYVSDTRDEIKVFDVDPASGHATAAVPAAIPVPPPSDAQPPDDFPPNPQARRSYPAGLALSADGAKLVVALNLSERVAVIDTQTRAVNQYVVRSDSQPGDRAYPQGVAIAGDRAVITDEGDGTVSSFPLSDPSKITRAQPAFADPSGINPKRRHPTGIIAAPDGRHVFVSLTSDDQVVELDAADPSNVVRRFDVRRTSNPGTQPVGMAVSADGRTLFVADTGEDVVRAFALTDRTVTLPPGTQLPPPVPVVAPPTPQPKPKPKPKPRPRVRRHHPQFKRHSHRPRHHARARRSRRRPHRAPARHAAAAPGTTQVTVRAGQELARVRAGIYPRQVLAGPSGQLLIVSSKGLGAGSTFEAGESVSVHILGSLQRIDLSGTPEQSDSRLAEAGRGGETVPVPVGLRETAPTGSPLAGPGGGASQQIKYVFYVVTENKTYDSVLGDLDRGNGDPCLALFGEFRSLRKKRDGSPCPQSGFGADDRGDRVNPGQRYDNTPVTPNEHKLARDFATLDNTYANSETSDDGHIWTSSAYAPDYDLRATLSNNGPGGYPFNLLYPVSSPPKGFFFDSAVRQGVSFFNYGEAAAGLAVPDTQADPEEAATRNRVRANSEFITQYPSSAGIDKDPVTQRKTYDRDPGRTLNPTTEVSRMQFFRRRFQQQVAACADPSTPATCQVPQYNELLFPNNHTAGTTPGRRTPDALIRDTDQAIGQLVSDISHSKIWPHAAIFVVQDDAQSGADHVEGHRITSLVASPWAKRGAVVPTHYDSVSVIRTIELILGMKPTYLYDRMANPMWDAFQSTPDARPYEPVSIPDPLMEEVNGSGAPLAAQSSKFAWVADAVPESEMNRINWAYRYGTASACPGRVGRKPYSPCANTDAEGTASDAARARGTIAALRRAAALRTP